MWYVVYVCACVRTKENLNATDFFLSIFPCAVAVKEKRKEKKVKEKI